MATPERGMIQRIEEAHLTLALPQEPDRGFQAEAALQLLEDVTTKIYLPFRGAPGYGTERAILVEEPHVPHRENDAEHSWHVAVGSLALYHNRKPLGMRFPRYFNAGSMVIDAVLHDVIEIEAADVCAMTNDKRAVLNKSENETAGADRIVKHTPAMKRAMQIWRRYERKDTFRSATVSDIDKLLGTIMIYVDGGAAWSHRWDRSGTTSYTSRERMCDTIRSKLRTDYGLQMMDALEAKLADKPELFSQNEYPMEEMFPGVGFIEGNGCRTH